MRNIVELYQVTSKDALERWTTLKAEGKVLSLNPVFKAMSAIFRAHCVNKIIDYSFYITPRILMAKFKMIVICKSVLKLTPVCPIRILMQKSKPVPGSASASAWQCSALCKAQVKAYLGVFRVTVNSPSVTRIICSPFFILRFLFTRGRVLYRTIFTVDAKITCTHMIACERLAFAFTIAHSVWYKHWADVSVSGDSKISPCAVQMPLLQPIIGVAVQYAPIARLAPDITN